MRFYTERPPEAGQYDCWAYYDGCDFVVRIHNNGRWVRLARANVLSITGVAEKKENLELLETALRNFFKLHPVPRVEEWFWHNVLFGKIVV